MLTKDQLRQILLDLPWPHRSYGPEAMIIEKLSEMSYRLKLTTNFYIEVWPKGLTVQITAPTVERGFIHAVDEWCKACRLPVDLIDRINMQVAKRVSC